MASIRARWRLPGRRRPGAAIPHADVRHLMPADEVIAAVAAGDFHVCAVETVDALVLTMTWTLFFIAWYALGIPVGPGWPVR
jgi:hypothetical protein